MEETQRTSRSGVFTPDCNMFLNRIVSGNGSFTNPYQSIAHSVRKKKEESDPTQAKPAGSFKQLNSSIRKGKGIRGNT